MTGPFEVVGQGAYDPATDEFTVKPVLTEEVAAKLLDVATTLDDVCQLWQDNDQAAFDHATAAGTGVYRQGSQIGRALGMSLEEMVAEIRAFVDAYEDVDDRPEWYHEGEWE